MNQPKHYVSRPVGVVALQWTGSNVAAVQAFVAPESPWWNTRELAVNVRDRMADAKWPALAPQFKSVAVPLQGWLVRQDGDQDVQVMTDQAFTTMFVPRPMVAQQTSDGMHKTPAPLAEQLAGMGAGAVGAFLPEVPIKATHPRLVAREPDAADGVGVDRPFGEDVTP